MMMGPLDGWGGTMSWALPVASGRAKADCASTTELGSPPAGRKVSLCSAVTITETGMLD